MCTIVCNLQRLKNGLEFNGSEGLVSSMNHIPNDVFWPHNCLQGVGMKLFPYFFLDRELLFIELKLGTHTK